MIKVGRCVKSSHLPLSPDFFGKAPNFWTWIIKHTKMPIMWQSFTAIAAQVTCDKVLLEQVKSFRYLGSIITDTCDCRTEIAARLGMARSTAKSLTSIWKDRSLNLQLKSRLMQTLVWSVATYGCESWTINAADRNRLHLRWTCIEGC